MSTREVDFAQNEDDEEDDMVDIDERDEVRFAPIARRLTDHERFSVALDDVPPIVVVFRDDLGNALMNFASGRPATR